MRVMTSAPPPDLEVVLGLRGDDAAVAQIHELDSDSRGADVDGQAVGALRGVARSHVRDAQALDALLYPSVTRPSCSRTAAASSRSTASDALTGSSSPSADTVRFQSL